MKIINQSSDLVVWLRSELLNLNSLLKDGERLGVKIQVDISEDGIGYIARILDSRNGCLASSKVTYGVCLWWRMNKMGKYQLNQS